MTLLPAQLAPFRRSRWRVPLVATLAMLTASSLVAGASTSASAGGFGRPFFSPGNLVVSGSDYQSDPSLITPGVTQLPPGCTGSNCVTATNDGTYPGVFNNALVDGSFGVTSPVFLEQLTPFGRPVNTLRVPVPGPGRGLGFGQDGLVTSFSSKSELALNLSASGRYVTFMGYVANPGQLDVSNSNTPGVVDPTNPVPSTFYRVTAQMNNMGKFTFTTTNAYSGNNGRAAILNDSGGSNLLYTSGNAGNGSTPQPDGVILGAGAQIMNPQFIPERMQQPGSPTPVGSFNITQLGDQPDKIGKDTDFRG